MHQKYVFFFLVVTRKLLFCTLSMWRNCFVSLLLKSSEISFLVRCTHRREKSLRTADYQVHLLLLHGDRRIQHRIPCSSDSVIGVRGGGGGGGGAGNGQRRVTLNVLSDSLHGQNRTLRYAARRPSAVEGAAGRWGTRAVTDSAAAAAAAPPPRRCITYR